ncbi:MAG: ATP-binding protein [Candidatus Woesearchaeota archaeon]
MEKNNSIPAEKLMDYNNAFFGIIGQEEAKKHIASAIMTNRNIIISGPPGIGKTSIAKSIAMLLGSITVNDCGYHCDPKEPLCPVCINAVREGKSMPVRELSPEERFIRVQGSPDLASEDLLGDIDPMTALRLGPTSIEAFKPGKIFTANQGILFFDEINRAPERLQNALLQVLEENIVTIGSYKIDFPARFILIGTMNPKDSSTEKLSEVFLDRFDIIPMDYPSTNDEEYNIIRMHATAIGSQVSDYIAKSIVSFSQSLRNNPYVLFGPSVRGTIGLYERASAHAALSGRNDATFDDVRAVAPSVLSHRIVLKPSAGFEKSKAEFIAEQYDSFEREISEKSDSLR